MTDAPLLGRCREEGCHHALFLADRSLVQTADSFKDVKAGNVVYRCQNAWWSRCPNRHKVFPLKAVKGTYSPDHKCDARCLNAKGHDCTCSCGGANHGRGYAVEVTAACPDPATCAVGGICATPGAEREPRHLGEVGKHIRGEVTVERARETHPDGPDSSLVIYTFRTLEGDKITWFCPAQYDPAWNEGETRTIRAKVKRHEDHERFGKSTVVTYVEEC
jgi:hypothetical protein